MSSQALQLGSRSGDPGFVQQGQVDWVAFGNTLVSGAMSIMQRCSAANVQPVTVAGGMALGSRFVLGEKGNRNMDVALKSLTGIYGYNEIIYFGFGYRSFVTVLTETQVGVNLVALCACLVDTHGIEIAADVLAALWRLEEFPENYEPSLSQFNALATACAGVIASTPFGQMGNMMLGDLRKLIGPENWRSGEPKGAVANARDIAKALQGLFNISRDVVDSIEVVGGPNCCFIAAFAHWLLNLTVCVKEEDGTIIYQNTWGSQTAQVTIRYLDMANLSKVMTIDSATYVLRNSDEWLAPAPLKRESMLAVRTPWDGCLERLFWRGYQKLKAHPKTAGRFLGSAAKLNEDLARGIAGYSPCDDFTREQYVDFVEDAYGYGFVVSVGTVFPELGRMQDLHAAMLSELESDVTVAPMNLRTLGKSLRELCGCSKCFDHTCNNGEIDRRHISGDSDCLLDLVMTISYLNIFNRCSREFFPKTAGDRQDTMLVYFILLRRQVFKASEKPETLLLEAQWLYTGDTTISRQQFTRTCRTAFSHRGICFCLGVLMGVSTDAAILRTIHVIPGHIQRASHQYSAVWDCQPSPVFDLPLAGCSLDFQQAPDQIREESIEIKALVTEFSDGGQLVFYYQANVGGNMQRICPGRLTNKVLERSGLILCDRVRCRESFYYPCRVIEQGWVTASERSRECHMYHFREDDVARCVAIELVQKQDLIIRQGQCLSCSTKTGKCDSYTVIV